MDAIEVYSGIIDDGLHSADLYFNIGNSYYKINDTPNSIFYYEKALLLDPDNESVKNNLAYAQSITQSKLLSDGANDLKQEERINGNVSVNLFILNKADPYTLGYLIALWEHRTFISASMLGINPFDQFGVIAGKIYTKRYIDNID